MMNISERPPKVRWHFCNKYSLHNKKNWLEFFFKGIIIQLVVFVSTIRRNARRQVGYHFPKKVKSIFKSYWSKIWGHHPRPWNLKQFKSFDRRSQFLGGQNDQISFFLNQQHICDICFLYILIKFLSIEHHLKSHHLQLYSTKEISSNPSIVAESSAAWADRWPAMV